MHAARLLTLLDDFVKREVHPGVFSDGSHFVGAHKPSDKPFLATDRGFLWHYSSKPQESYFGIREEALAEALAHELDEGPQLALWRVAVAMHWRFQDGMQEPFFQAIVEGAANALNDDALFRLLGSSEPPRSPWQRLAAREVPEEAWERVAAFTRLACMEIARDTTVVVPADEATLHVWSLALSLVWKAAIPQLPDERQLATMISLGAWPNGRAGLFDASLNPQLDTSPNQSLAHKIARSIAPDDKPWIELASATRSWLHPPSADPLCELEYIIRVLRFYLNRDRSSRGEAHAFSWRFSSPSHEEGHPNELASAVRFVQHVESSVFHAHGLEGESHRIRAVQAGHQIGDWLPAVAPSIVRAFARDNEEAIASIMTAIATQPMLDRLAEMVAPDSTESLQTSGCVAGTILRRCGRIPLTQDPAELRELLGPFEPIRGQTWLNDERIEHVLYEAVRGAESAFSRYYASAHGEHEDYLLRDLLDDRVRPALGEAIRQINTIVNRAGDRWGLHWSKLQPIEERAVGADLALVVEIHARQRVALRRAAFLQVKSMRKWRGRFSSGWRIDREQLEAIRTASDSSFYLLLSPQVVPSSSASFVRTPYTGSWRRLPRRKVFPMDQPVPTRIRSPNSWCTTFSGHGRAPNNIKYSTGWTAERASSLGIS